MKYVEKAVFQYNWDEVVSNVVCALEIAYKGRKKDHELFRKFVTEKYPELVQMIRATMKTRDICFVDEQHFLCPVDLSKAFKASWSRDGLLTVKVDGRIHGDYSVELDGFGVYSDGAKIGKLEEPYNEYNYLDESHFASYENDFKKVLFAVPSIAFDDEADDYDDSEFDYQMIMLVSSNADEKITISNCMVDDISIETEHGGCEMEQFGSLLVYYQGRYIRELELPQGIKAIDSIAIFNEDLKKLTIPEGVTFLPSNLLGEHSTLEEIVLPSTLKAVELGFFDKCKKLKHVTAKSDFVIVCYEHVSKKYLVDSGLARLESVVSSHIPLEEWGLTIQAVAKSADLMFEAISNGKLAKDDPVVLSNIEYFKKNALELSSFAEYPNLIAGLKEMGLYLENTTFPGAKARKAPQRHVSVMVKFAKGKALLYNCEYPICVGDKVTVFGKKEGEIGEIVSIGIWDKRNSTKSVKSIEVVGENDSLADIDGAIIEKVSCKLICLHSDGTIPADGLLQSIDDSAFLGFRGSTLHIPEGVAVSVESLQNCIFADVICAPRMDISAFNSDTKIKLAFGYMQLFSEGKLPQDVHPSQASYIKRRKAALLEYAIKYPAVVDYFVKNKLLKPNDVDYLLKLAEEKGATDIVAMLLPLVQKKTLSLDDEPEKPITVAQIKTEWNYEKLPDGTIAITSYKGKVKEDVTFPAVIGRVPVTKIQNGFHITRDAVCPKIWRIPEGILEIGKSAFRDGSPTDIYIPSTVKKYGEGAFRYFWSSNTIHITNLKNFLSAEFEGRHSSPFCGGATVEIDGVTNKIVIPEDICSIAPIVFEEFGGHVVVHDNYRFTSPLPFGLRVSGIEYSSVKAMLEIYSQSKYDKGFKVNEDDFNYYTPEYKLIINGEEINSLTIEGIKKIQNYMLINCNIQELIIGSGVEEIGKGAFAYSGLRKVQCWDGLKKVGKDAFNSKDSWSRIPLPDIIERLKPKKND